MDNLNFNVPINGINSNKEQTNFNNEDIQENRYTKTYFFETEFVGQDETFKEIPNGYIDKTVCGCGLTSVALENDLNTIVAVPNVALVINKVSQYPNIRYSGEIFGVYGGVNEKDINNYLKRTKIIKIMVTYDSLYKVDFLLDKCRLIIDESDQLLKHIKLKVNGTNYNVYNYLLDKAREYKDTVSFISATPTPLKYLPQWISEIPYIKLYFSNVIKVKPILMKRAYPFRALKEEILRPLKNNEEITIGNRTFKKAIIFINSVENIIKIIKDCNLNRDDVAILCSDNTRNDIKIRGYNRIENPNKLPKYTFITSSGFQGIDLVDDNAINIVVSNTTKDHYMINLLTDLKQATSRQRNKKNPNYDTFIYIYNQSTFEKTENELLDIINDNRKQIESNCSLLNELLERNDNKFASTLKTFKDSELFNAYSLEENGKYIFNEMVFNSDKYFILETRKQFTKGFNVIGAFDDEPIIIKAPKISSPFSYETLLEKYKESINDDSIIFSEDEKATENYQIIDTYYKQNKSFTNNSSYAKKMLKATGNDWLKIYYEIRNRLKTERYLKKDLIKILSNIYEKYGISRKPKETDLLEFNVNYQKKKVNGYYYLDILSFDVSRKS